MDINRNSMETLFQGFNAAFLKGMEEVPSAWKKFCGLLPSGTSSNLYPFLEQFSGMREWTGERQAKNIASAKLEVVNRDFEETIAIARNDIEDDQYGIYSTLIAQLGFHAGRLWQDLAIEALLSNPLWIDSLPFFSDARSYGNSPVSNVTGAALSEESYADARKTMMSYCGHGGKNLGIRPDLLIVGPANESRGFAILKDRLALHTLSEGSITGVGATDNPWNGSAELLVLPELSGDRENEWFLAASSGVLKPVFVQQRKLPVLVRMDSETDENVFFRKEYFYGTDARGEAFLAFPHLLYHGGVEE